MSEEKTVKPFRLVSATSGGPALDGGNLPIYDDGEGVLWTFISACGHFTFPACVIRAESWERAYEIWEDEFADSATFQDVVDDYWSDFLKEAGPQKREYEQASPKLRDEFHDWLGINACYHENYGYRSGTGGPEGQEPSVLFHKEPDGCLERLSREIREQYQIAINLEFEKE